MRGVLRVVFIFIILLSVGNMAVADGSDVVTFKRFKGYYKDDIDYYYFTPSASQKKRAGKMLKQIKGLKKNKKFKVTSKQCKDITNLFGILNIDYLYYTGIDMSQECNDKGVVSYTIKGKNAKEWVKRNKIIAKKYKEVEKEIGLVKGMNSFDAARRIHDYICEHMEYGQDTKKNKKLYEESSSLFSGVGVCMDYSECFYQMCRDCGIECYKVIDYNMYHSFNMVIINDVDYYVDVTWDDALGVVDYFMVDREQIEKDHVISKVE